MRSCCEPGICMRALIFALTALAALSGSPRAGVAAENTTTLARACQKLEAGLKGRGDNISIPNTKDALLCWGYMLAMQDIARLADPAGISLIGACVPSDGRLTDLIHAFVAYARTHRDAAAENTALVVIKALQQAYPCEENGAAPKP